MAVLVLAACAKAPLETEADRAARGFFEAVRTSDVRAVDALLSPAASAPDRAQRFEQARRAIPGGPVSETRAVGWVRTEVAGRKRLGTVHLYRYPGADLAVSTVLERTPPGNGYKVVGFYLSRLPPGAVEANRFTLAGKSLRQLSFLLSAFASPLIMLGVAVLVILAPGLKLKPLWFALCFVGVGLAYMNWTNGQGGFSPAQISLINFGFTRATDISPWIVRFSAPVGALLVLARLILHKGRPKLATA